MAQFGSLKFTVSPDMAMLFQKMQLSAECETNEETGGTQQFVTAKNGKPAQVSMTIPLYAALGVDVREMTMKILNTAQRGTRDFFYVGGKKLFPFKMMMTKAEIKEMVIAPSGTWVSAEVDATFQQSSAAWIIGKEKNQAGVSAGGGGGEEGGGGGYAPQKQSVNTTTPTTSTTDRNKTAHDLLWERGSAYQGVGAHPIRKASSAVSSAAKTIEDAKSKTSTVTK